MKKYILLTGFSIIMTTIFAQKNPQQIIFFEPSELSLNTDSILSHRIELKETSFIDNKENLESYTYVTLDNIKQFGERMILINWMSVTVFGTGLDLCIVSSQDMSLRHRITPKGLPLGFLIESHAFDKEINVIEVNADAQNHIEEIRTVYPPISQLNQKPTYKTKHIGHYNVIVWPYLFASMNLKIKDKFILPGFNTYSNKEYYYRVDVEKQVDYKGLNGNIYKVYKINGIGKPSLEAAKSVQPTDEGARTSYYVSNEAPYFFGKELYHFDDNGDKIITRRWTLNSWQINSVNPTAKKEELIEEWKKFQKQQEIIIPWYKNN